MEAIEFFECTKKHLIISSNWKMLNNSLGKLPFIVQDFKTKKIISILGNRHQSTICNHFFRHSKEKARNSMQIVIQDKSGHYILLWKCCSLKLRYYLIIFTSFNTWTMHYSWQCSKTLKLTLNTPKEKTNFVSSRA